MINYSSLEEFYRWSRLKVGRKPEPTLIYSVHDGTLCAYIDTRDEGSCVIFYAKVEIKLLGYIDKSGKTIDFYGTLYLLHGDILKFKPNQM